MSSLQAIWTVLQNLGTDFCSDSEEAKAVHVACNADIGHAEYGLPWLSVKYGPQHDRNWNNISSVVFFMMGDLSWLRSHRCKVIESHKRS